MLAAVLTTLLFSVSAIFGRRVSHLLSGTQTNLGRLGFAAILLGSWSHVFGFGLHGRAFPILFLSGGVGFGLGDLAMFQAYRRIGARRTVVIIQCLAAPLGTVAEWLWLGHAPTLAQAAYGVVILAGVGIALQPVNPEEESNREAGAIASVPAGPLTTGSGVVIECAPRQPRIDRGLKIGVLFGVAAAVGQAGGAVLSRKAYALATAVGEPFHSTVGDGINAAYQRVLGGIAVSICIFIFLRLVHQPAHPALSDWRRGAPWLVGHALAGPAAGVTCFQWALMLKPANIVLPIVATTPLAVMPLAHFYEGDPVTRRALIGSAIAVAGVIGLLQVT